MALSPEHIVVAGGTLAVSQGVEKELAKIAPVTRVAGADRYSTSAKIAALFPEGAPAFVTTGQNFSDATVAAAPAAKLGGPVILTSTGAVNDQAASALSALAPSKVFIVGGT